MKRLVVCSDGTWNSADHGNATNVVRIVQAITPQAPDGTPQIVFYDQGVGTRNWIDKWIGGITGSGLSKNVQDAYRSPLAYRPSNLESYLGRPGHHLAAAGTELKEESDEAPAKGA